MYRLESLSSGVLIMGILNVTPDSFSDGGQFDDVKAAIERGKELFTQGADIVDVGGESTRPGSQAVPLEIELERVVPVVEELSEYGVVSVDTKKPEVAEKAIQVGASIVNDVSAQLGEVAGRNSVGYIAMHMQGLPENMQQDPTYGDVTDEVLRYLLESAKAAKEAGSPRVWIDPGFGFGKTLSHNLELLSNLKTLVESDFEVAIGTSRKSMFGHLLAMADGQEKPVKVDDRQVGSLFSEWIAMNQGVTLVRVHDVANTHKLRGLSKGTPT